MVKVRIWGSLQTATENNEFVEVEACLLYTSDAADE